MKTGAAQGDAKMSASIFGAAHVAVADVADGRILALGDAVPSNSNVVSSSSRAAGRDPELMCT